MIMSNDLHFLTIAEASRKIARRELSPVELVRAMIARTQSLDAQINAFITPTFELAACRRAAIPARIVGITAGPRQTGGVSILQRIGCDRDDHRNRGGRLAMPGRFATDSAANYAVPRLAKSNAPYVEAMNGTEKGACFARVVLGATRFDSPWFCP